MKLEQQKKVREMIQKRKEMARLRAAGQRKVEVEKKLAVLGKVVSVLKKVVC